MILTIIGWIVFGLIVGFIARALVPGKDNIGFFATIILGVLGSVVGGLLGSLLFSPHQLSFKSPVGWIGSIVVAIILLVVYNKATGRKRARP
ncbi:GlsB/YeaQ/YmgE family stress response membrane protein [Actinomycetospora sp.]|uniref:GlsB/YeaQ/YmgE family stress response membrane protein n=1 Tax=Actinomycetospora sp. TaxID=1872135 RepID=UPI002F4233C1